MFRLFRGWSLRTKIVVLGISQLIVVAGAVFYLNFRQARSAARDECVARARSIVLTAESVREEMARKWKLGLFDQQTLVTWAKQGQLDKVLGAVPVVTAWKSAMAKAAEGGYEFRVPKFQPRNAANEPDAAEARALKEFAAAADKTEYYEADPSHNSIRYFRPIRLTGECLLCHGDPATSKELWGNGRGLDPTGGRMENWKVGELHGAFEVVQSLDEADARAMASFWNAAGVVGALVVLGGVAFFLLVSRCVTTPLRQTVAAFRTFAGGNLRVTLPVNSADEVGQLRESVNTLMERLRAMIERMSHCSADLAGASAQLSQTAEELSGGATETTRQSSTVAAAAEEMSANMKTMAHSTEQMSVNVKTVADSVEGMTAAIAEVASSAEQAASVADNAARLAQTSNEKIGVLGAAADKIGKVIEVIQDIAEQTNLLALNASIEAARAGDSGKGFAVVATEVKELAKQTADATDDIRQRIQGIQASTSEAVRSINEIGRVVARVNEASRTIAAAVEEQSATTKEIARNVAQAASGAQAVSQGVAETALATQEVTQNISRVDQNAKRTAEGASHTRQAGTALIDLADQLQTLVGQFQV